MYYLGLGWQLQRLPFGLPHYDSSYPTSLRPRDPTNKHVSPNEVQGLGTSAEPVGHNISQILARTLLPGPHMPHELDQGL